MSSKDTSHPMRVLAWPLKGKRGNPYTRLLYSELRDLGVEIDEFTPPRLLNGDYDVWHIHWPDGAFNRSSLLASFRGAAGLLILLEIARWRGIRIVWTGHNVGEHDASFPALSQWVWRRFVSRIDSVISLSYSGKEALCLRFEELNEKPHFVIPHGHYRGVYPAEISRSKARKRLGIAAANTVFLHFGHLRPYKNAGSLIRAFQSYADPAARLVVAGQPENEALAWELQHASASDDRIQLDLHFIPEEDVQVYFRAADVAALPYEDILHSGSAMLALSFDCPVVVPKKGGMTELQQMTGSKWVRLFEPPLSARHMDHIVDWVRDVPRGERAPLEAYDWSEIATRTLDAFRAICGR